MADSVPFTPVRSRLHRFFAARVKFLLMAMPAACAVLLLPLEGWLLELLRHFRLWCGGLALILLGLTLLLRLWRWVPVALLTVVWQGWPWWGYADRNPAERPAAAARSFSLLTANLLYEAREPEKMIAALREANADVLVLQEYTPAWQAHFRASLWNDYPYRLEEPAEAAFGICLASRLPLEKAERRYDPNDIPCVAAVVITGTGRAGILGVHPYPPMMPSGYEAWRTSLAAYPAMLRELPAEHWVLAGDLNATPFCRAFQQLCEQAALTDTARVSGVESSWFLRSRLLPFYLPAGLPLDHVLVSEKLGILTRETGPEAGSDHRYVRVELALP
jgi:endonuclease/exonuclease/phosphatase (EEP) superfamily protein YafD